MSDASLRQARSAAELPGGWDALASCYFQRREFLGHAEAHNPCGQRYHWRERDGRALAGAVVYTLPLDLLTFAGIRSPLRMQLVGVPCSVSAPGVLGEDAEIQELVRALLGVERGLLIGLNLDRPLGLPPALDGRTLPTVVLERRFEGLEGYLGALRSDYRRRLGRHRAAWRGVTVERGDCGSFDEEAHGLYLQVWARSRARLERLTLPFFRALPARFTFTRYRQGGRLLGWHICLADGDRFFFFLGGVDGSPRESAGAYFNVLLGVLEEWLASGAATLDFGQTAEVPKTRLGGRVVEKRLFAHHPNPVVRLLLWAGRRALEYSVQVPETHVFRSQAVPR